VASQNTFGLSAGTTNQQLSNPSLVLPKQQSANRLLGLPGTTNQQSADQSLGLLKLKHRLACRNNQPTIS